MSRGEGVERHPGLSMNIISGHRPVIRLNLQHNTMLDFCVRHDIYPVVEEFPLAKVNDALAHLEAGKARYRIVLKV